MPLRQVTVSAAVGKQVVPTAEQASLKGVILTPSGGNATVKIRDGNASGEVVLFVRGTSAAGQSVYYPAHHKFTKGMHVKVIGDDAEAYLVLN